MFGVAKAIYRGALREPMIRKRGHNYYKGTGVGAQGQHSKHAQYFIKLNKLRHYVVPDLKDFKLTPYVSHRTERVWKSSKPEDFLNSISQS